MSAHFDPTPPAAPAPDVALLLRAHSEQHWLSRELVPVLRQLEHPQLLPDEQLGAALAYLEVIWIEAAKRAFETDSERQRLDRVGPTDRALGRRARRYHAAVRTLRDVAARRVAALIAVPPDIGSCADRDGAAHADISAHAKGAYR